MSNNSHRTRLARALARKTGWPYQRALAHVRHAADVGLLPVSLARADLEAIAGTLALLPPAGRLPRGWRSVQCWHLEDPGGVPEDDGRGTPHFSDRAAAEAAAADRPGGPWRTVRIAYPCLVVSCRNCGYLFDEDEAIAHFPLVAGALGDVARTAVDFEWFVVDGGVLCPACSCLATGRHRYAAGVAECLDCETARPSSRFDELVTVLSAQEAREAVASAAGPIIVVGYVGSRASTLAEARPLVLHAPTQDAATQALPA